MRRSAVAERQYVGRPIPRYFINAAIPVDDRRTTHPETLQHAADKIDQIRAGHTDEVMGRIPPGWSRAREG